MVRGKNYGAATKDERREWVNRARIFLQSACDDEAAEQGVRVLPQVLDRLSSFYQAHAVERQYQSIGVCFAGVYPVLGDLTPIEQRKLIIECLDRWSCNVTRACFFLYRKRARYLPIWDILHLRWGSAKNALGRAGMWRNVRLMGITFKVNKSPFKGYAFFPATGRRRRSFGGPGARDGPLAEFQPGSHLQREGSRGDSSQRDGSG